MMQGRAARLKITDEKDKIFLFLCFQHEDRLDNPYFLSLLLFLYAGLPVSH
ncbi:Uncharacterised protein [Chlamydia trachomatis]|nr:Uncharacterised protein [Chlamydia trachomatis]